MNIVVRNKFSSKMKNSATEIDYYSYTNRYQTLDEEQRRYSNMERYNLGLDFKGKTTPSNTPYLKIKIKGINLENSEFWKDGFDAILDTGAVKTHITPKFAKLLSLILKPIREDVGLYPLKEGVSNTSVYEIDFYINGIKQIFTEEFSELPYEFPFPIILGTEFLSKCKSLSIDFINHNYSLRL